jgi:Domain of unknown function (DUF4189)
MARSVLLAAALLLAPDAGLQAQAPGGTTPAQSPAPWVERPTLFGAIAFTADGSFSSAWRYASKAEVEAKVRDDCAKFERGQCEIVSFRAELCAALATFRFGKDRKVTYAGGGLTAVDAKKAALERCNRDHRARGRCELRTVACGDGR